MKSLGALAAAALALAPAAARAHEVLHEVERGRAIAVRAFHAGGAPLANVQYEVYSPAEPRVAHQKGRTDRRGWLAFVPDAPGAWRVRVFDATGHGLDVRVEAPAAAPVPAGPTSTPSPDPAAAPAAAATPPAAPPAAPALPGAGAPADPAPLSTAAFVLRPLAGLAALLAVFAALYAYHRRRRA